MRRRPGDFEYASIGKNPSDAVRAIRAPMGLQSVMFAIVVVVGVAAAVMFGLFVSTYVKWDLLASRIDQEQALRTEGQHILQLNISELSTNVDVLESMLNISTGEGVQFENGEFSLKALAPDPMGTYGTGTVVPRVTVDEYGRITGVQNTMIDLVNWVGTGVGLTGGPITMAGTISLANTTVTPGEYTYATIEVDAQGRITMASSGTDFTSQVNTNTMDIQMINNVLETLNMTVVGDVNMSLSTILMDVEHLKMKNATVREIRTGAGLTGGPITVDGEISLEVISPPLTTGTYGGASTSAVIEVDQHGRVTSAANVTIDNGVSSITTGTGLLGGTITSVGTISLNDTEVTPGMYTFATITVDQQGRLTFAESGTDFSGDITNLSNEIIMLNNVIASLNMTLEGNVNMTIGTLLEDVELLKMKNATVREVRTGTGLTGGPITSTGTISLEPLSPPVGGMVGSSTQIPQLSIDAYGRVTSATTVPISGGGGSDIWVLAGVAGSTNVGSNQRVVFDTIFASSGGTFSFSPGTPGQLCGGGIMTQNSVWELSIFFAHRDQSNFADPTPDPVWEIEDGFGNNQQFVGTVTQFTGQYTSTISTVMSIPTSLPCLGIFNRGPRPQTILGNLGALARGTRVFMRKIQ